jgi:release factor glutamine methyltransferase
MTVADALREARAANVERLDAQLLLARLLNRPRSWLLAHDDAVLDTTAAAAWHALLVRRAAGEPLAYLLGEKEFRGLMLKVDPRVLVPRPETEHLVDWALELLDGALHDRAAPRVIDLGTGSGAIAIAVRHAHPAADMTATDASEAALAVARDNAQRLGLAIRFAAGSWWSAVPDAAEAGFDLALSNPPYIAERDPHLPALNHEPAAALTPGGDGLGALRAIIAGAAQRLAPGGWLLVEHGFDQADAVQALLRAHGFASIETRADLAGQPRCSGGQRG